MENGNPPPREPSDESTGTKRWSVQTVSLLCIYLLVFAEGASHVFSFDNRAVQLLFSIGFVIFTTIWTIHDQSKRGGNFYYVLRIVYLLTCPISTVIYLIYSRGWWGLIWAVANFIAIVLVSQVAYYATYYLIYFSGFWDLYDPIHFEY